MITRVAWQSPPAIIELPLLFFAPHPTFPGACSIVSSSFMHRAFLGLPRNQGIPISVLHLWQIHSKSISSSMGQLPIRLFAFFSQHHHGPKQGSCSVPVVWLEQNLLRYTHQTTSAKITVLPQSTNSTFPLRYTLWWVWFYCSISTTSKSLLAMLSH